LYLQLLRQNWNSDLRLIQQYRHQTIIRHGLHRTGLSGQDDPNPLSWLQGGYHNSQTDSTTNLFIERPLRWAIQMNPGAFTAFWQEC
jgi:hypothetical protein